VTSYSLVFSNASGSVNVTNKTKSARLSRSLGEASTLELDCVGLADNYVMDDVTLTVDGVVHFRGTVKEQEEYKSEGSRFTKIKCLDGTDKLHRRMVAEVYTNQTAKQILLDLITRYASWVNTSLVNDIGGTLETVQFNYNTLTEAIQKLADTTGAYWYLDADNKLHFFDVQDGLASINYDATLSGTAVGSVIKDSFTLRTSAVDLINRIWVIGAKSASATYTEQFWTGDGNNSVFNLAYEPNYVEVFENGVARTIEVDKGGTSTKDYTYNKQNKVLTRVAGALTSGVLLRFRYRPTVQIIDYFEDPGSVSSFGLYEKAIRDKKITDKAAARKRGRAALKKSKGLIRYPSFSTRSWQVGAGQLTTVNVPSFGFNAKCRINSVSVSFSPADIVADIEVQEVLS
jgi:hypothetical protein